MLWLAQISHFPLCGMVPTESQHTIHINNVKYETLKHIYLKKDYNVYKKISISQIDQN